MHGYQANAELERRQVRDWAGLSRPQIYYSLEKLARRREPIYLPGHGGPVRDAPRFVQSYIHHRQAREVSILRRLGKGAADIATLVRAIYIGIDPRLTGAASLSVLAHLEDLVARGVVATEGIPSIGGTYRLTEFPLPAA